MSVATPHSSDAMSQVPHEDQLLTPDEYAAVGLTQDEGDALYRWIFQRVGYVVGAKGRGGSGVFVKTPEGRVALLTARHVAIDCILTGEIQVAANIEGRGRFQKPRSIRLSTKCDAALLTMPDDAIVPFALDVADWNPDRHEDPSPGTPVIAAGMPGLWKAEPDLEKRQIERGRTLLLWTEARHTSFGRLIEIKADKRIGGLPRTLRGMSGGPLFNIQRELLGVTHAETISDVVEGSLFSVARDAWRDLFHPWIPDDVPGDLMGMTVGSDPIVGVGDVQIPLRIVAELFWSPSDPNHRYGGVGRINSIEFFKDDPSRQCLANVEWIFYFELDHTDRDRTRAFEDEIRPLLNALSIVEDRRPIGG
jgi:hypothetical protein